MHVIRCLILLISTGVSAVALAQPAAPLPKTLNGTWTAVVPGRATFSDSMSVVLDVPAEPGPVTGRMTSRGVTCGALDEPLAGTWDGKELRFESKVRPNVNVARMNGDCASGRVTYLLTRKPGQAKFEGEGQRDGMSIPVQVTLSP
jgi:hypothetical protein